jgi:hypothetical protein
MSAVEGLAHPLADELDQRVELELRRQRLPDAFTVASSATRWRVSWIRRAY